MKKIMSVILSMVLIITLASTAVYAKPAWKGGSGKNLPYGIEKKLFDDADEVIWAQHAIEKLKSKGLVRGTNGKFFPNKPVTKIEAVAMALRIMDWEDEALSVENLPVQYKGEGVQTWAIGYVTTAYEKGILDEVDMKYFKPNEPAKRYEVAKYVIRALGKEDEAEKYMEANLPFLDKSEIPQGAIGYVYLVNELGIMKGNGRYFNPMGNLTRAEMAVLFNSLDEKIDGDKDVNEFTGIVSNLDIDGKIVLKVGTLNKTFNVSDEVVVYNGRTRIHYDDILEGSRVLLQVENNEVVYIEVLDENSTNNKIITRYTGELTQIRTTAPKTITVKIDTMTAIFNVIDNVTVYFKGVKGDFNGLKAGDHITVSVDNRNRAIRISVDRELTVYKQEIKGSITKIDLSGDYHLSVDGKEYDLSKNADVEIDHGDAALNELVVGMKVEAQVEDNIITAIYAQTALLELTGTIEQVGSESIKILIDNQVREYRYAKVLAIDVLGHSDSLSSLEKGMKVELKLKNNLVTSIYAEDKRYEIDGKIIDIYKSNGIYQLKLKAGSHEYVYKVSNDVAVIVEGTNHANMLSLKDGMKGEFEVLNSTVVKISIYQ